MRTYILRRLLQAIPLLVFISGLCFGLMHLAPGGPLARLQENPRARPEDIEMLKKNLGLDKPLPVQYARWAGRMLHGDLGTSYTTGEPVLAMIKQRIPPTMKLMLTAFVLALAIGLAIGIITGLRPATATDYAATLFSFIGISIPVFWLALMCQVVFGAWLKWLPVTARAASMSDPTLLDHIKDLILPVGVLSLLYIASWSRYMRGTLIEVMSQDYIRTARAKGLAAATVVFRHGVRNALVPVVTIVAIQIPELFTGAIITETIFAWPGMGRLFYDGIQKGDYPRLMAILMISSVLIVLFNLIADVLYAVLDPRISYK